MIRLVHHHLRRGGVTRVMLSAARILRDADEPVELVTGEPPSETVPEGVRIRVLPELQYGESCEADALDALVRTLRDMTAPGDLWHVHNHSLGKNPLVTAAYLRLAKDGVPMVLQPHDFAEDGRPVNYARLRDTLPAGISDLYPVADHIRYAVLQTRDMEVLSGAGIPADHIHLLPNPVPTGPAVAPPSSPPETVLYLSRMIRRKNTGEFLYWALRYRGERRFATSLIPENPVERSGFEKWRDFACEAGIEVDWGLGMDGRPFAEVVGAGDICLTTSVGEGFGMTFLEPYRMGRAIVGRDLPSITGGFKQDGIDMSALYTELPIPATWLEGTFWRRAVRTVGRWERAMGVPPRVDEETLRGSWISEGAVDFGRLDEDTQRTVLRRMGQEGIPDRLAERSLPLDAPHPVNANGQVLDEKYDDAATLDRLRNLYADVGASGPVEFGQAELVRDAFLDVSHLSLLRM